MVGPDGRELQDLIELGFEAGRLDVVEDKRHLPPRVWRYPAKSSRQLAIVPRRVRFAKIAMQATRIETQVIMRIGRALKDRPPKSSLIGRLSVVRHLQSSRG